MKTPCAPIPLLLNHHDWFEWTILQTVHCNTAFVLTKIMGLPKDAHFLIPGALWTCYITGQKQQLVDFKIRFFFFLRLPLKKRRLEEQPVINKEQSRSKWCDTLLLALKMGEAGSQFNAGSLWGNVLTNSLQGNLAFNLTIAKQGTPWANKQTRKQIIPSNLQKQM